MGKKKKKMIKAEVSQSSPNIELDNEPKIDFDTWFALRQESIPSQHRKEVIKADFEARGLDYMESQETFDKALRLYGVRIG